MFGNLFGGFGRSHCTNMLKSCDIMWIIILLLVLFNGGLFGLDICTLVILAIVFGHQFWGKERCHHGRDDCRC